MVPVIGIAVLAILGVKWAASLPQPSRTRLMNHMDQFSMMSAVASRMMTAADSFRVAVAWTDTWPRTEEGIVDYTERFPPSPLNVPNPVAKTMPTQQQSAAPRELNRNLRDTFSGDFATM